MFILEMVEAILEGSSSEDDLFDEHLWVMLSYYSVSWHDMHLSCWILK